MPKTLLQKLLNKLGDPFGSKTFRDFDNGVERLKAKLKETITTKTLDEVNSELTKFRRREYLQDTIKSVDELKASFDQEKSLLTDTLTNKLKELDFLSQEAFSNDAQKFTGLETEINELNLKLFNLDEKTKELQVLKTEVSSKNEILINQLTALTDRLSETNNNILDTRKEAQDLKDLIEQNKLDTIARISRIGGGSMNRQILVEGVDVLNRYTDINLKGSITAANDNTNKRVDITFAGGGGTPASPNTSVQFNDSGAFGGDSALLWDKNNNFLKLVSARGASSIRFEGTSGESWGSLNPTGFNLNDDSEVAWLYLNPNTNSYLNLISPNGSGNGPNFSIRAAAGGTLDGNGGFIELVAGSAQSGNSAGGYVSLSAGNSFGSFDAGYISLNGGSAVETGIGGAIGLSAGNGGNTSGDGGSIFITAGSAQGGNSAGGNAVLSAGAAVGNIAGGQVNINSGPNNDSGFNGAFLFMSGSSDVATATVTLSGGHNDHDGDFTEGTVLIIGGSDDSDHFQKAVNIQDSGGAVNIGTHNSRGDGEAGGAITIQAGKGGDTSGNPGQVNITSGAGGDNSSLDGGDITIQANTGGGTGGKGGDVSLNGGNARGGDNDGGDVTNAGGDAHGNGNGGNMLFRGGNSFNQAASLIEVEGGGQDTYSLGLTGYIILKGGDGQNGGGSSGGDIILRPGLKDTSGTNGKVRIFDPTSVKQAILSTTLLTADQTFSFPDQTGLLMVPKTDRSTAQTAAKALTAYTVGAADGSFLVSANVNVTTSTAFSFGLTCTYTDETNASRVLSLSFSNLAGTFLQTITNVLGAGAYEGIPLHIRAKAATTITIASVGTFTTVTYNLEEMITQIA